MTIYEDAVHAIGRGDLAAVESLLQRHPELVKASCYEGEWYSQGYFRGAKLLHHIAGNPIRCPIAPNIVEVTKLLLDRGADPNATTGAGSATVGLLLTSQQASQALVALPLLDVLVAGGARYGLNSPTVLDGPLLNLAPETAGELVRRGAKMQLRHAAGLGRLDDLEALLRESPDAMLREEALLFACVRGQEGAVSMLLGGGARGGVLLGPCGMTPRTALHEAANRGHLEIVRRLLEGGAGRNVVEPRWGGTPAGWARHGGHSAVAELLESQPD